MAITINIYYKGSGENAKRFADEMIASGIVEKIQNEDGNLRYEYFYPRNDRNTVLLIDSWKDQESLDIHHASSIMEEIVKLREKYDLHMTVEKYVSDADIGDSKYIRK